MIDEESGPAAVGPWSGNVSGGGGGIATREADVADPGKGTGPTAKWGPSETGGARRLPIELRSAQSPPVCSSTVPVVEPPSDVPGSSPASSPVSSPAPSPVSSPALSPVSSPAPSPVSSPASSPVSPPA